MTRPRLAYRPTMALILAATVGLGLLSRSLRLGLIGWDKYVGDGLYAVAFYLGLCLLLGSGRRRTKLVLALLYVTGIEVFQLSAIPRRLGHSDSALVRLFARGVLGSTFSWWDLLAYAAGLAAIFAIDRWISARHAPQSPAVAAVSLSK
jgi:hypothetical protein